MAVLGTIARLGLDQLLDATPSRTRDRAVALIAARVLEPGSKLATARALTAETRHSTLGETCGLTAVDEDDLYATLDWLGAATRDRSGAGGAASHRGHAGPV